SSPRVPPTPSEPPGACSQRLAAAHSSPRRRRSRDHMRQRVARIVSPCPRPGSRSDHRLDELGLAATYSCAAVSLPWSCPPATRHLSAWRRARGDEAVAITASVCYGCGRSSSKNGPSSEKGSLTMKTTYGQFCSVAKASEVIAERWTPLIVRELVLGSHRF